MNGKKTRMVFCVGFLLLSLVAAGADEKKQDPKLNCAVDNPLDSGAKREATPREAGRLASSLWKDARGQSNNRSMSNTWISRFADCFYASGLALNDVVPDRDYFRHTVVRTLRGNRERITKQAESLSVENELRTFDMQAQAALGLYPELAPDIKQLRFSRKEQDELVSRHEGALAEEKSNCSPRDLSSRLGMVRNQTDMGWCYAFSAAELVTFRLGPENPNFHRRVSAVDMAFLYNREHKRDAARSQGLDIEEQEGGVEVDSLKSALRYGGFCLEEDSPSEDFAYGLLKETLNEVEGFKVEAENGSITDEQACADFRHARELFPNLQFNDFFRILRAIGDSNLEYFEKLNDKNCRKNRHTYGLEESMIHMVSDKSGREYVRALDKQLDRNNIAAISFPFKMISPGGKGNHAVTVVGRRYNTEKHSCEYLLRNSWGLGCAGSLKQDLCAKDHSGHLWVGREALEENLMRVTYLE